MKSLKLFSLTIFAALACTQAQAMMQFLRRGQPVVRKTATTMRPQTMRFMSSKLETQHEPQNNNQHSPSQEELVQSFNEMLKTKTSYKKSAEDKQAHDDAETKKYDLFGNIFIGANVALSTLFIPYAFYKACIELNEQSNKITLKEFQKNRK